LAEAIESASLDVVAIVPAAFLIARAVQRTSQFHGPFRLLLTHDGATEDLTVDAAGVGQWKHYHDFEELRCNRALIEDAETPRPETVAVGDFGGAWAGALPATRREASAITLLVQGAELALAGQWRSWPNLRQDGLAAQDPLAAVAKPLRRLAFAAALCFVALIIAARYRGWRIETASRSLQAQQRAAFRETFPSRRVPVLLMRTIRREHQRTIGSRATGGEIDLPTPAVKVLAGLLDGLQGARQQGAARFRVIDLNITDGECGLTVRARNAVQLGTIAKALESAGFAVEPPAAEQIAANETEPIATFQSTLSARWRDGGGDDTAADAPPRAAAGGPR
jgi:hypothetical protein